MLSKSEEMHAKCAEILLMSNLVVSVHILLNNFRGVGGWAMRILIMHFHAFRFYIVEISVLLKNDIICHLRCINLEIQFCQISTGRLKNVGNWDKAGVDVCVYMAHRTKHLLEVTKQAGTEVCQAKVSLWLATNYHHQVDQTKIIRQSCLD